MKGKDLQYGVVTDRVLARLRRRRPDDSRIRQFDRMKRLYESLARVVAGLAEAPSGELAAELRSVAANCEDRDQRHLLSLLVLNSSPVWEGRPRAAFDALLAALESDDELCRDLCRSIVADTLPGRDELLFPALTTFVPRLRELSPEDLRELEEAENPRERLLEMGATDDDLDAAGEAQLELLEAMHCLGRLEASPILPRYAVVWLARLGEDPEALTRRLLADLSAGRLSGPASGHPAKVWLGVLDLVEETAAELDEELVEEIVETTCDHPAAPVRRRAYELAAALLDAAVVERGLEDRDRGVRDRCERLLQDGSARGGAAPTLPWD